MNPGIRKLVAWLNAKGWPTCDSGDGKTHDHGCDRDHAYVIVRLPAYRAERLTRECDALRDAIHTETEGRLNLYAQDMDATPCIQGSYDPANQMAFIDLMNVDDAMMWPEASQ